MVVSCVKCIESAGTRAVATRFDHTCAEYAELFSSINRILFPGGSISILH